MRPVKSRNFGDIEDEYDLPGVEIEDGDSEDPKPGFWDHLWNLIAFWRPKVEKVKAKSVVITEKDLGIHNFNTLFRVKEDGIPEKILGDYYPAGKEFLIAEKEAKDREDSEWIIYRKKFNKKAGCEQITEHIRLDIRQIKRTVLMIRDWDDWDDEEDDDDTEGSPGQGTDPGGS
jgi:hypothetical protein